MRDLGTFSATAYGPPWEGIQGTGVTAGGTNLTNAPEAFIVAVDPNVIPLGTKLRIDPNPFGTEEAFLADDTGGAIIGKRIDFYDWRGRARQQAWGVRDVSVWEVSGAEARNPAAPGRPAPTTSPDSQRGAASPDAIFDDDKRSGALRALVWVALVGGGTALIWTGFGKAFGITPSQLIQPAKAAKAGRDAAG